MQDTTFIRKDFYVDPPTAGASKKDWDAWIKRDNRKAAAHKAQVTKAQKHCDIPQEFQSTSMSKVNGVWTQSMAIGFTGSGEDNTLAGEVVVEAQQEHHIALVGMEHNRHKRGGSRAGKSARRRKNRRLRVLQGGKK